MEYLVTYGWALLALVLVVALLFASGAFSSTSFAVQECTFQPDLPCPSFVLYRSSHAPSGAIDQTTLQFRLSNGLGFPINVTNVTYVVNDLGQPGRNVSTGVPPHGTFASGNDNIEFSQNFTGPSQPGSRTFKTVLVSLTYKNAKSGSGPYTTSGRVSAIVEQPVQ